MSAVCGAIAVPDLLVLYVKDQTLQSDASFASILECHVTRWDLAPTFYSVVLILFCLPLLEHTFLAAG